MLQDGVQAPQSKVRAAMRLVADVFGPWMAHHIMPAALRAGLDLRKDILPAAMAALTVCLRCALCQQLSARKACARSAAGAALTLSVSTAAACLLSQ